MSDPTKRSAEITHLLLANKLQIDNHFKSINLREAEFRKQKLGLLDRELHVHHKIANGSGNNNQQRKEPVPRSPIVGNANSPKDLRARAGGALRISADSISPKGPHGQDGRSRSSPAFHSNVRAQKFGVSRPESASRQSLGQPISNAGLCRTRFSVSQATSGHPSPHPGAFISPRIASSKHATTKGQRLLMGRAASASGALTPLGMATPDQQSTCSSPLKVDTLQTKNNGIIQDDEFSAYYNQENSFDFESSDNFGGLIGALARRPTDPPETIERLGGLMALLGPRYKTLPLEVLWQKAATNNTPLQRRELRLGGTNSAWMAASPPRPRRLPEEAPDADPDGIARAAWIAARGQERECGDKTPSPLAPRCASTLSMRSRNP